MARERIFTPARRARSGCAVSEVDDTRPVLTPTLAHRVDEIERAVGEIPLGSRAILARLLTRYRAEDYGAGREQRALSQTMGAVKP
jgi:hypothetical protein